MTTPLGDSILSHVPQDPSQSLNQSILTSHVAQRNQTLEAQRRRDEARQGLELQTIFSAEDHPEPEEQNHHSFVNNRFTAASRDDVEKSLLSESPTSSRPSSEQMRTRSTRSANHHVPDRPRDSISSENGHAAGNMNNHVEMRRKNLAIDSPTSASQTENLMSREGFSLDSEPPPTPQTPRHSSKGFWELSEQDRKNFLFLVLLYFLQGIPMGLASGSVPFLLKDLSYSRIGVFSLAIYPYSLKLLWSPIVDAVWSPRFGRRKSWIMPVQMLSGFGLIWLGGRAKQMMIDVAADGGASIWHFTSWWFFLVFMCATQDIAVDGWALTLLSPSNLSYASTAQTVGLTAGQFMSYTVFLAFNSADFANKYFRTVKQDEGIMTLGGYLVFWGWVYLFVTIGLAVFKKEEKTRERDGITDVYKIMWGILKLRNIQIFVIVHLISKIGFQANDAVTNLKLLKKGLSQEDLALTVLINFPFEISLGYYVGKWSSTYPPMHLWCYAFIGRLLAAVFAQLTVVFFPKDGVSTSYLLVIITEHIFSIFMSTVMFVSVSAFHAKIADPTIGGTYMTLLATVSNLGGTFPRIFVLKLVDFFTSATCLAPATIADGKSLFGRQEGVFDSSASSAFSCAMAAEKDRCEKLGRTCLVHRDGYYITNIVCVIIGVVTFWSFIRPAVMKLQALPLRAWRLGEGQRY